MLFHWNNRPGVDMLLNSDTLSWFQANPSLLFLLNSASREAANTNVIVFGLTQLGLKPTNYHTRGEHTNTTDEDNYLSKFEITKFNCILKYNLDLMNM